MKRKLFLTCYISGLAIFFCVTALIGKDISESTKLIAENTSTYNVSYETVQTQYATPVNINAKAAVLIDAKSGSLLFGKNEHEKLPMASTTKIMTALVILNNMDINTIVTVPKAATLVEGSSIYLKENEKITVEALLYGLLLESGNDAAYALAVACSGSIRDFAFLMNKTAKEFGLCNTNFVNPHGLSDNEHYTTAYELSQITFYAMKNEKFREIVSTKSTLIPLLDGSSSRFFANHNKMLRFYNGANGVKTGYTKAAGRCLVSSAFKNGNEYIAVTLNDSTDWNDHTNMLNYAFENHKSIQIAEKNKFAVYKDGIRYSNKDDVYVTIPNKTAPEVKYSAETGSDFVCVRFFLDETEAGKFYLFPNKSDAR